MRLIAAVLLLIGLFGCSNESMAESPPESTIVSTPQAKDFNQYFRRLGEQVDVVIPHEFHVGDAFDQEKVNENFDAVLEGIYEMKQKMGGI